MLSALEAALRRQGHAVATASNGIEAASKLEKETVQAVITDLRMPGMNGLELLQHVRRTKPAMPVIVLSAYGTVPMAVEAIKAGASDFLMKPFSHEALDEVLNKLSAGGSRIRTDLPTPGNISPKPLMLLLPGQARQTRENPTPHLLPGGNG